MGSGLEVVSQFCLLTPRDRFVDLSVGDFGFDTCIVIALMLSQCTQLLSISAEK